MKLNQFCSETIQVNFNNPAILHDIDGNALMNNKTTKEIFFTYTFLSEDEKAKAQQQSNASIVTMLLTFGSSIFLQVALGGSIEATWLLFGGIQLMSLVPLFDLNLPANFREFAKNLAILHGEPQILPNYFSKYIATEKLKPFNEYFGLMSKILSIILDFKTNAIFMNAGRKIELWGITFAIMGFVFILSD